MTEGRLVRISAAELLCSAMALAAWAADEQMSVAAPGKAICIAESAAGAADGSSAASAKPVAFFNAPAKWASRDRNPPSSAPEKT